MKTEQQITRRGLLMAGGAVLAARRGRAEGAAARGVRFGVRSPLPKASLHERALMVHRVGFDGIELGPEWLDQPVASIQEQLAGTGAAVSAIVGSIQLLDTDPKKRAEAVEIDRRRLRMAKALAADCVIEVPVFGPNRFPDREVEKKLLVAGLKQIAGDVESTGITLLLEPCNHKETHFMNRQSQAAETIEAVGAPGFKILSDFYHMQIEEKDIGETLGRYGKYTGYVHLADGEKRTEPGSMPFDYRPGFHSLKKWGFAGWLTVESGATDNPEAALGRALAYLKRQWNEA
jgi:D-psicose/D-tagatose/L-ribulose 3-epimerase